MEQLKGKENYKLNSTSANKPNYRGYMGLQEESKWLNFEIWEEIKKKIMHFKGHRMAQKSYWTPG